MSADFLQQLIRGLYAESSVTAAYLGGDLTRSDPAGLDHIDLYLEATDGFAEGVGEWLAPLGQLAYSGPAREGRGASAWSVLAQRGGATEVPGRWRAITPDGVEWLIHFTVPVDRTGLHPLFDRGTGAVGQREETGAAQQAGGGRDPAWQAGAGASLDLSQMAGHFWTDLWRAAGALTRGEVLTAHGILESCRLDLVDLYRIALAPDLGRGGGWDGADRTPGVRQALEPTLEWLVAPLDRLAQWRCANRLAAAYESLMLPLCQRLGAAYPMAMRNLAFQRLDQARPDRAAGAPEAPGGRTEPEATAKPHPETGGGAKTRPEPAGKLKVSRGQIRRP